MAENGQKHQTLDTLTFLRVRKWYILALATIALTIVVAQVLIQNHLDSQLSDSRVINVAGRQRAYSQKLVKESLLLQKGAEDTSLPERLKETLYVWETSHSGLLYGNDSIGLPKEENPEIIQLFTELQPHHTTMVEAVKSILQKQRTKAAIDQEVNTLLQNEQYFLTKMDAIVNAYDTISKERLQQLKLKEYLLLGISLLILLLEVLFIFKPMSIQIKRTIGDLMQRRQQSEMDAQKIQKIAEDRQASLQELKELNFAIDNAALFASTDRNGKIAFISKKFLGLLGLEKTPVNSYLYEALTQNEGQQQYLRELLSLKKRNIRTEEIKIQNHKGIEIWLDMSIIPMFQTTLKQSILILCSNSTERKKNEAEIAALNQRNYEDRMQQKQVQASLIVAGQEEERKRIAKDIHDGIGQMLTALRFNIQSINLDHPEKAAEKVAYLKDLTSDLIKGVRTATFNLTPPELGDHGIFPALQKMTTELAKLTGQNVLFENKAEVNIRFNSLAETNIYRVTQEAVNNAIKYAQANYILVIIDVTENLLSVSIEDDGKGFDTSILSKPPKNNSEGGMGVFFMKERIGYINGRLFFNSNPGNGTRVTINYDLQYEN